MVQSYAILAFPLAAFNQAILRSWGKYLIIPIYLFCTWLNLHQTYQAHAERGGLDPEYMTKAYYWRIFGRTNIPDSDRILMDTDEDFLGERKAVRQIFKEDFESYRDTTNVRIGSGFESQMGIFLNGDYQLSPVLEIPWENQGGEWLRVSGQFYAPWKEWDTWRMAKLKVAFYQGEEVVKERFVRVFRVLPTEQWKTIWIDVRLPEEPFDRIQCWLDHSGSTTHLIADNITVEVFEE